MDALRKSVHDLTQDDMKQLGITKSDLRLTRSELRNMINRWKYLDHHDDRFAKLQKCRFLLGERLTAQEKAALKVQLKEMMAGEKPKPPVRPPASAGAIVQTQQTPIRSNQMQINVVQSKNIENYSPVRRPASAGAIVQSQQTPIGLNATDSGNADQGPSSVHSSASSAKTSSVSSISDASKKTHQVEGMKVCSKPWIRKHRVKLGILGAFMVICIIAIIFGAIYGPRKDDGGEETAIINTHVVTDVTEDMNSSPTVPMESVRSTQEETETETTQKLRTEPPETSSVATSIETKAKHGTLHPPRKPKRLELLLAILGLSGVAILLIIGAMMMRKMRRGRSRAARYL